MSVRLTDNTEKVKALMKSQIALRLNQAAQSWTTEAKNNANVKTGFMKAHIGVTVTATPDSLESEVRSLAPYSGPQDTGMNGNLFWTKAYLDTRSKFKSFLFGTGESAGPGVISAALEAFHGRRP